MNKKIKRIIAITLAVSAFSAIAPVKYLNFVTTEVYAATIYGISNLEVNEGSGSNNLQLYNSSRCDATDKISFSNSTSRYYVETNSNGVNITFNEESGYYAKVKRGSSGDYSSGDRIHIANGDTMTLNVYVYDKVTDNKVNSYTVSVKQTTKSSSSTDYSYSYNNDDDDNVYLDNIKLSEGDISFSSTKSTYTVNVGSSIDQIRVTALPEDEDDTVKINGTTVDDNDDYRKTVPLNNGKNEINIRVRDEDNKLRTYTLYVYRGGSVDSTTSTSTTSANQEDNYQDDIFLDDLVFYNNIGEVNINFRPKVTTYNVNVSSATDNITLKATPEDDDNIVRVNGEKVNTKHSRGVDLKEGKNVIEVKVDNTNEYEKDDDEYRNRIYTLNVYRGAAATGTTTSGTATNTQTLKANQWVSTSGRWQYNGEDGLPLKNQWHFDNNYAKWYYFDGNGFMHTGWLALSLGWYYLNANGSMATGWIEDGGKYYHFNSDGVMDHDTTIDKYVLGSNGAWIG